MQNVDDKDEAENMQANQLKFYRIPTPYGSERLNKKKKVQDSNVNRQSCAIRQVLRQECVERVGFDSKRMDVRICSQHKVEHITKHVPWIDIQGQQCWTLVRMFVPEAANNKNNNVDESNQATESEGNKDNGDCSIDTSTRGCNKNREMNEIQQEEEQIIAAADPRNKDDDEEEATTGTATVNPPPFPDDFDLSEWEKQMDQNYFEKLLSTNGYTSVFTCHYDSSFIHPCNGNVVVENTDEEIVVVVEEEEANTEIASTNEMMYW
jgi:hypothetical protein